MPRTFLRAHDLIHKLEMHMLSIIIDMGSESDITAYFCPSFSGIYRAYNTTYDTLYLHA